VPEVPLQSGDPVRDGGQSRGALGARLTAERGKRYGHPTQQWGRVAVFWSEIVGAEISPEQVGLMMLAWKLSRLCHSPFDEDSLRDVVGYVAAMQLLQGIEPTV